MLLALMRGLFVAGALSSFGASLFTKFILLPVAGEFGAEPSKMVSRRLRAIMAGSLGVALLAVVAVGCSTFISGALSAARDSKAATFSERFAPALNSLSSG